MNIYANNWSGYGEFLGTGRIGNKDLQFLDYKSAKKYASSLNLKNEHEWRKITKSKNFPKNIPVGADRVYKKTNDWISWGDFLGTGKVA